MGFWNKDEPLGLPKGSVRALLALGTIFSSIALLAIGKIDANTFEILCAAIIAFYFVSKNATTS